MSTYTARLTRTVLTLHISARTTSAGGLWIKSTQRSASTLVIENSPSARPDVASLPKQVSSAQTSTELTPLQLYENEVASKKLRNDEHQRKILASLEQVHASLLAYYPSDGGLAPPTKAPSGKFWGSMLRVLRRKRENSSDLPIELQDESFAWPGPKGLYIYGDVGCGKTMLMDIFYRVVPQQLTKRRVHFHQFMQGVHKRSFVLKKEKGLGYDTADEIAREIAESANVLCFDEMQVTDVGDAMILRRILRKLYELGVVTFFTSNRAPDDLYKNGVQRELFVPTIHLLQSRNCVIDVDSPMDYRSVARPQSDVYFFDDPKLSVEENHHLAEAHSQKMFACFACGETPVTNRVIKVWGRTIHIPRSAGNRVAQFSFAQLCGEAHSSADYLELCRTFGGIVLTDIPRLSAENRDLLRRFITFLDAAYDAHTKLAAEAARPFELLCDGIPQHHLEAAEKKQEQHEKGQSNSTLEEYEGVDEVFAFARALSRLRQMNSRDWLEYER